MTQLTKNLYCIAMRNGVEIWLEEDRIQKLQQTLSTIEKNKFVLIDNETINTADLIGIFKANTMEDVRKRKNGQWKCKGLNWHDRGERCECASQEEKKRLDARTEAIKACGKCDSGWIRTDRDTVRKCECTKNLTK